MHIDDYIIVVTSYNFNILAMLVRLIIFMHWTGMNALSELHVNVLNAE